MQNAATNVKIQIGVTPSISATNGAPIVTNLANILQIPIEVALNKVGKRTSFPRYTMLKAAEIPNFVNKSRIGKVQVPSALYPQIPITKPPIAVLPKDNIRDHFIPILLNAGAEATVATQSLKADAYVLVNIFPGNTLS